MPYAFHLDGGEGSAAVEAQGLPISRGKGDVTHPDARRLPGVSVVRGDGILVEGR